MTTNQAGKLISENMSTIYRWALSRVQDPVEAEDLSSDIIAAVLSSAQNLECDDAFYGYIWRIADNTYKNYLRKKSRHPVAELKDDVSDNSNILDDICDNEETSALRRELAFLSEKYRICTVAYYFEGMSMKEISEKYGYSTDSVKVNLFKSRKMLKEGISMAREFGEKSFKPAQIQITTLIVGENNQFYNTIINLRISGQIIHCTYFEPMTMQQIAVEPGVPCYYIEEMVFILEQIGLLKKQADKYYSNILLLTKEYMETAANIMTQKLSERTVSVIESIKSKLTKIKEIGFEGSDTLSNNLLMWDIFTYFCIKAMQQTDGGANFRPLYDDTTGVVCAHTHGWWQVPLYGYTSLAGSTDDTIDGKRATFIDFSCINTITCRICDIPAAEYPWFTNAELDELHKLLDSEFEALKQIFREAGEIQVKTLYDFAPECSKPLIKDYCPHITMWSMVGWFGYTALSSGALDKPKDGEYAGIPGYLE